MHQQFKSRSPPIQLSRREVRKTETRPARRPRRRGLQRGSDTDAGGRSQHRFSTEKNFPDHGAAHELLVAVTWLDAFAAAQILQQRQAILAAKVDELDVLHVVVEEDTWCGQTERSLAFPVDDRMDGLARKQGSRWRIAGRDRDGRDENR